MIHLLLKAKYAQQKRQNEKLQMEVMQTKVWQAQPLEEEMEDEVDGQLSLFKLNDLPYNYVYFLCLLLIDSLNGIFTIYYQITTIYKNFTL